MDSLGFRFPVLALVCVGWVLCGGIWGVGVEVDVDDMGRGEGWGSVGVSVWVGVWRGGGSRGKNWSGNQKWWGIFWWRDFCCGCLNAGVWECLFIDEDMPWFEEFFRYRGLILGIVCCKIWRAAMESIGSQRYKDKSSLGFCHRGFHRGICFLLWNWVID